MCIRIHSQKAQPFLPRPGFLKRSTFPSPGFLKITIEKLNISFPRISQNHNCLTTASLRFSVLLVFWMQSCNNGWGSMCCMHLAAAIYPLHFVAAIMLEPTAYINMANSKNNSSQCAIFFPKKRNLCTCCKDSIFFAPGCKFHQKQKHFPKLQQKEPFDGPSIEAVDFISDGTISSRDP